MENVSGRSADYNLRNDFRTHVSAISFLATPHADTTEGLGTVRFLRAHFSHDATQFADGDHLAAADDGVLR